MLVWNPWGALAVVAGSAMAAVGLWVYFAQPRRAQNRWLAPALFMLFRRVEGVARRVADRAMPGVRDTEEYRMVRKREVYRAALEGALADGTVTDKERAILARLQGELGLSAGEARAVERDVQARAQGVG